MDYKDYKSGATNDHFWFQAKKDLLKAMLSKLSAKDKKNTKILSIGAGVSDDLKIMNEFGMVYATDLDKKVLDILPPKYCRKKQVADACDLPFKDNSFDFVVSLDVFEHIADDAKAISEARRVLKKDGFLIFTVPAFQFIYSNYDRIVEHKRRYGRKDLLKKLSIFSDVWVGYWNFVLFIPVAISRLIEKKSKSKNRTLVKTPARPINNFLYNLLLLENFLIRSNFKFPFGLSLVGYCKK